MKSTQRLFVLGTFLSFLPFGFLAQAEIRPDKVYVADFKKNQLYRKEGLVTGGDRLIGNVVIKDIRRASNREGGPGAKGDTYERIVIDLQGMLNGETAAISRPPYYQLALKPKKNRILVSIWGNPQLAFDSKKVANEFKKSSIIREIKLLPKVEQDLWTFAIDLKIPLNVEVFELRGPARVIVDISKKNTSGT